MIPLSLMNTGDQARVVQIGGAGHLAKTLRELGIVVGGNVEIVHKSHESIIIRAKETRYALGAGVAGVILVTPLTSQDL